MLEIKKTFTTQLFRAELEVEDHEKGLRLDQLLASYLSSFSRQQIKKKIMTGDVRIQGRPFPHRPSAKVHPKERIIISTSRGELEDEYWKGEKLELDLDPEIIFEDENILAICKPAYMSTHPTGKRLFNCATVYFEQRYQQTMHSIHRLDRETSGILLLGKNPKSAQKCGEMFENSQVKKCYFFMAKKAKTYSPLPFTANERMGQEDDFIPRLYVHCYPFDSKNGKSAETDFIKVIENDQYLLGLAFPKTGRQHQIRAHAAHHGLPLIGDKLYNGDPLIFGRFKDGVASEKDHELMELSRHALHAIALSLPYPSENERLLVRANLPKDFMPWISKNFPQLKENELVKMCDKLIKERL